jgi:hypothetical protein
MLPCSTRWSIPWSIHGPRPEEPEQNYAGPNRHIGQLVTGRAAAAGSALALPGCWWLGRSESEVQRRRRHRSELVASRLSCRVPSRLAGRLGTGWKARLSSRGWGCHGGCNLGALLRIRFETADTGDPTIPEPQETHGERAVNIGVVYMCVLFVVVLRQKIKPGVGLLETVKTNFTIVVLY